MRIKSKRILLVHPDMEAQISTSVLLRYFGHEVWFASGWERASQYLDRISCDLIMVNHKLDDMTGMEFLQRLGIEERKKVIFLSKVHSLEELHAVHALGVFKLIAGSPKPLELAVIACDYFVSTKLNRQAIPHEGMESRFKGDCARSGPI